MKRNFYIDAENTQQEWLKILPHLNGNDTVHLFTSAAVSYAAEPPAITKCKIIKHHCNGGHRNAMDFLIVGLLGYLAHKYPARQHIVISKDLGFDTAASIIPNDNVVRMSPHSFIEKVSVGAKV